jgi:hypothetical protein
MVFVGKRNVYRIELPPTPSSSATVVDPPTALAVSNLQVDVKTVATSMPSNSGSNQQVQQLADSITACAYALPFTAGQFDPYSAATDASCPSAIASNPVQVQEQQQS